MNLQAIQQFFQTDFWKNKQQQSQIVLACEQMRANDGNRKAVTAFLQMAVHFYGKEQITATIENYGFERLKKYL